METMIKKLKEKQAILLHGSANGGGQVIVDQDVAVNLLNHMPLSEAGTYLKVQEERKPTASKTGLTSFK